ncbi:MAG: SCP2 sterol-binding domain-containing protein [Deltaproteobacteria bacterium]|nr:SCP2 sterol-binding domain-containing protein [Deltaproteobacteria bacterium]
MNRNLKENPESMQGFDCVYQFEIDGKVWNLDLYQSEPQIKSGAHSDPDCTLKISAENFEKLLRRDLNIPMALVTGKIKISGDKTLALKLGGLFSS